MALAWVWDLFNKHEVPNKFTLYMGERIREAREESAVSQTQLAEAIYKRRASISEMETGKMIPDVIDLSLIADKLQKPITYFFPPYAKVFSSSGELKEDEIELIQQFRRISDSDRKELALQQIRAIAEMPTKTK